jgi:prophage regulatory protein
MSESLLRLDAVKGRVGLGRSKILLLVQEGGFPQPVNITGRVKGWLASEVDRWIEDRVRESRPEHMEEV